MSTDPARPPFLDPDVDREEPSLPYRAWPSLPAAHIAVVFGGGILGGLARYGIGVAWPAPGGTFPTAILVVNTVGAFVLAVIVSVVALRSAPSYLRPLLGTGFCGAFTTFSSVVTADDLLFAHAHAGIAIGYLAASLAAGLSAVYAGMSLTGRVLGARS
jgi:CrcB protein